MDGSGNIFILACPGKICCDEKIYHSHGRRGFSMSYRLLGIVTICLMLANFLPESDSRAIPRSGVSGLKGIKLANEHISTPPTIPQRLIFISKEKPSAVNYGYDLANAADPLLEDVLHNVKKHREHLNEDPRGPMEGSSPIEITFLSHEKCREVIEDIEPRLVTPFERERRVTFKSDICKMAELYLRGGYYYDSVDRFKSLEHLIQATKSRVEIMQADDITTFEAFDENGFFPPHFLAAMPRHPVLRKALDVMVAYYHRKSYKSIVRRFWSERWKMNLEEVDLNKIDLGSYSLSIAYKTATTNQEWQQYIDNSLRRHGYKVGPASPTGSAKERYSRLLHER